MNWEAAFGFLAALSVCVLVCTGIYVATEIPNTQEEHVNTRRVKRVMWWALAATAFFGFIAIGLSV